MPRRHICSARYLGMTGEGLGWRGSRGVVAGVERSAAGGLASGGRAMRSTKGGGALGVERG